MEEIKRLIRQFAATGTMDPGLLERLKQLKDPQQLDEVLAELKALGAHEAGSGPPLNIQDYVPPSPGPYQLLWPLDPALPLPFPFDQLDGSTQFHVLFGEWSRRELEGSLALNGGKADEAERTFQECLQRAEQIDVAELKARSYEGLMRVAQRRGDRQAEQRWLKAALAARGSPPAGAR